METQITKWLPIGVNFFKVNGHVIKSQTENMEWLKKECIRIKGTEIRVKEKTGRDSVNLFDIYDHAALFKVQA